MFTFLEKNFDNFFQTSRKILNTIDLFNDAEMLCQRRIWEGCKPRLAQGTGCISAG